MLYGNMHVARNRCSRNILVIASSKLTIKNTNYEHRNCDGRNNSSEYVILLEHFQFSFKDVLQFSFGSIASYRLSS